MQSQPTLAEGSHLIDMNESVPHVWLPSCAHILSQGWVLRKLQKCSRRMTTPHVDIVDIGRDEPAFCTCSGEMGCRGEMGLALQYAAQLRTAENILQTKLEDSFCGGDWHAFRAFDIH